MRALEAEAQTAELEAQTLQEMGLELPVTAGAVDPRQALLARHKLANSCFIGKVAYDEPLSRDQKVQRVLHLLELRMAQGAEHARRLSVSPRGPAASPMSALEEAARRHKRRNTTPCQR